MTVIDDQDLTITADDQVFCDGGSTELSVAVSGAGDTHFQWQYFTGGSWTNVGTDQPTYITGALATGLHNYRVIVTQNTVCVVTSAEIQLTVLDDPTVTISANDLEFCEGGSTIITASVSDGTGPNNF